MKKHRICFLTNTYPDTGSSYRGVFIRKMALHLRREGYGISVVTPKICRDSHYAEQQEGIPVYRFPFFSANRQLIEYKRIPYLRMVLYFVTGFFLTLYVMLKNRCKLIHVHWAIPTGVIGVAVGTLLRRPLLVTIHGSDFRMATRGRSSPRKVFLAVCKRATYLTCVSEFMRKGMEEMGIDGKKILTFPMGVDEIFFNIGREREKQGKRPSSFVLSNRNLHALYNVPLLIKAIPRVLKEEPHVKFLIAGEGPEKENLQKQVSDQKIGDAVQFLGGVPHERMGKLLGEVDIYVSTSRYDGTSVSLLEAMASGAFPVVADIPSNQEWITDQENGFLFPVDDDVLLAEKILKAIRDSALVVSARRKNGESVERRASWRKNIEKICGLYESYLKAN